MFLVPIAWLYVVVMMSVVEAMSPHGTLLGACFTFLLYGLLPLALVMYLLGTPARRRARLAQAVAQAEQTSASASNPDGRGLPSGDAVPPVRVEP